MSTVVGGKGRDETSCRQQGLGGWGVCVCATRGNRNRNCNGGGCAGWGREPRCRVHVATHGPLKNLTARLHESSVSPSSIAIVLNLAPGGSGMHRIGIRKLVVVCVLVPEVVTVVVVPVVVGDVVCDTVAVVVRVSVAVVVAVNVAEVVAVVVRLRVRVDVRDVVAVDVGVSVGVAVRDVVGVDRWHSRNEWSRKLSYAAPMSSRVAPHAPASAR